MDTLLGILLLLAHILCHARGLTWDTCVGSKHYVEVTPDADVTIGAILNIHSPGKGIYGCGPPTAEGVEVFEALRWTVSVLNQNSGVIHDQPVGESFIPGVKFGLKVFDSCGHEGAAVKQLTELFPILQSGTTCSVKQENSSLVIGFVDMSGAIKTPQVMESLHDYFIPGIPLHLSTAVPPDQVASTLAEVAVDMKWQRFAILHADDEYSIHVTKTIGQLAKSDDQLCLTKLESIPVAETVSSTPELRAYQKVLERLAARLEDNMAVMVIAHGETLRRLLQAMAVVSEAVNRLQWLFSWVPDPLLLADLGQALNAKNVYSLAPYPRGIRQLEERWARLQDRSSNSISSPQDRWFLEYVMARKNCQVRGFNKEELNDLPVCANLALRESTGDVLVRTSRVIPALHSVFTYAHAFRRAWEIKCLNQPGICPALRQMSRREFVGQYLEPLDFDHSPRSRSPPEITGRKTPETRAGEIEGVKLGLTVYSYDQNLGVEPQQVIVYDYTGANVLDPNFEYLPTLCPATGCKNCVKVREGRLGNKNSEGIEMIGNPKDILIPVLLPIHKSGNSPLQCSNVVDPLAVQDLEAILWTIDKINDDTEFLSGMQLGTVVIDTCGSSLKATQRLSDYLASHVVQGVDSLDIESTLTFVVSGNSEESEAAAAVLGPLNITSIATSEVNLDRKTASDNYNLQVNVPVEIRVRATIEVLKYLGWSFVSILYSEDDQSHQAYNTFRKLAKSGGVCLAAEHGVGGESKNDDAQMHLAILKLKEAKSRGANVVILLLNVHDTKIFFSAIKQAIASKIISRGDFIWMGSNNLEIFSDFEKEAAGALIFRQEQGEVREFMTHYRRLRPESNKRNPWFREFWEQEAGCTDGDCAKVSSTGQSLQYVSNPAIINTIQAVLAVAAGLARLRDEVCGAEKGLCPRILQQSKIRHTVNQYIRYTSSARLDEKNEMFSFTKGGYGDLPVEILNLRKGPTGDFNKQKVGSYHNRLTSLVNMVTYNSAEDEITMDHVSSECRVGCGRCKGQTSDFLILDSTDNFYIVGTFGVHLPNTNPLECGPLSSSLGLQNVEAFLWALDEVNKNANVLPGVKLGAIVFDTCGSREKTARDVSNFFSRSQNDVITLPLVNDVAGFVADQSYVVVKPVVDITMSLNITTVAPQASSTIFNDVEKYRYLLRLSLPNNLLADSLASLLRHFRWNYVSVVYSHDNRQQIDVFRSFQAEAERRGIQFALVEKVTSHSEQVNTAMDNIVHRLKIKQEEGARVVILLLTTDHTDQLLTAVKQLQMTGRSHIGDFIWVTIDNVEVFHRFPEQSLGTLSIRSSSSMVTSFKQHFLGLSLRNNSRNPWFREYWEQVFNCRGAACYSELHKNLQDVPFTQEPTVVDTINSVFALTLGLEASRQKLCPGFGPGLCPEMREDPHYRDLILNFTKNVSFTGVDGSSVKFTSNHYGVGQLDVLNFRQVGSNAHAFITVGSYTEKEGLSVNLTRVKGYDEHAQEISLHNFYSQCLKNEMCHGGAISRSPSVMQVLPTENFALSALVPVHQPGEDFFTCGPLNHVDIFQNLVALSYAVDNLNKNKTILPEINLGVLVFDYCGREQRAEEKLFSYFAKEGNGETSESQIKPSAVLATLTFNDGIAEEVYPILQANHIPQITNPVASTLVRRDTSVSLTLKTVPPVMSQIQAVIGLLNKFSWHYVHVIHSNDDFGREAHWELVKGAKESEICISRALLVNPGSSSKDIENQLTSLSDPNARVIILLSDDGLLTRSVLQAASDLNLLNHFVWIGTEGWGTDSKIAELVEDTVVNAFTVKMESYDVPELKRCYGAKTLGKHEPIPDAWFEEFWQHHFRCQLANSQVVQRQYPDVCSGQERLNEENFKQDKYVYHTVTAVNAIGRGLHSYLRTHCIHGDAAMSIEDCGENAREMLTTEIKTELMGHNMDCEECESSSESAFGYQIFSLKKNNESKKKNYVQVGIWKNGRLQLQEEQVTFSNGETPTSLCFGTCQEKCSKQFGDVKADNLFQPGPIYMNFKTVWGIIVTALSLLGIALVVICASYFLMAFPVTVGTTVLGYLILFGLLILYAVNFSFILAPTESTCGVRRFVMGLAYAIVFSGMLVKVMNAWRLMGYKGNRMLHDGTRLTSPAGLLMVAVGLVVIQVILAAAWLVLMPPKIGVYERVWRCAPPTTFEAELIISLVYVMLLLALSILFSILTWHCADNNRESRWILVCCVLMALVWLAWTILCTQLPLAYRDTTIIVANLVCATIVMLCLYMRKVYLYSKLTRQARDLEVKTRLHPTQYAPTMFGALGKSNVAPILYGSQASLNNKKIYSHGPARIVLENAQSEGGSSTSSVQVQGTDLYPLEMYDGGSQFQPGPVFDGNNFLILDDNVTFSR
ncbi:uncharacterized protein LOC106472974 isoform X2 [Limulus polyphemus]|uniref:Uncharacterized protein LOC106472974 isoform X2 n=1 Tax=Limulus polyphemus TaxID=6850 RepID=A0ABM1TMU7_LIMPO|nr:uncharacterized protein LOC106472974 isoform X2 [Limulus polyphemus]